MYSLPVLLQEYNFCILLISNNVNLLLLGNNVDREMKILLALAIIFVVCQFFPIIGDVYKLVGTIRGTSTNGIRAFNMHIENCIAFANFMLILNSSANFAFYMMNIVEFRQGLLKVNQIYI